MKRVLLSLVFILSLLALNAQTTLARFQLENNYNFSVNNTQGTPTATNSGGAFSGTACEGDYSYSTNTNGNYLEITINTTGFQAINIYWDHQRTGGSNQNEWELYGDANNDANFEYSNTGFGNLPNNCNTLPTHALPATFDNKSTVKLRIQRGGSGTRLNHLDDIFITGTPITTATPALSPSTLAPFGDVCINTIAGPNTFTISGSNLTNQNVTVGALSGYTYATSAGGTYTSSLNLAQGGGTYNQTIFVKFTPTAVASYNGSIPVGGGGAATVNVAASGNGVSVPSSTINNPNPSGATDVCYDGGGVVTALSWNAVPSATSYDVYFGTATNPGFVANVTTNSYDFGGGLAASTSYYWKVVPKNACGDATSPSTWSFTTASAPCNNDYCDVNITEVRSITRVVYNEIDNSSSPSTGSAAYEDYTSIVATVALGDSDTFTVEGFTNGNNTFHYNVYIDWNQNGNFNDGGEGYYAGTITNSTGADGQSNFTTIIVPTNALPGLTGMRVISSPSQLASDPCDGTLTEGQVEDYTVNVTCFPIDYANLQSPGSVTICESESLTAYGQVYEGGLTDTNSGQAPGFVVEFGYNITNNTDPSSWPEANWTSAIPNPGYDFNQNNDEYQYTFTPPSAGIYYYTFRYSLDGCDWQYGGYPNGFWNGTSQNSGVLTVNEAPVITTTYSNISINSDSGQCGAIVNYPTASATGVPTPSISYSQASGTFFPVGTTNVTVTATNSCGSDTKTFNVTVTDNEPPLITCEADVTANTDSGECFATINLTEPTTSDNCSSIGNALNFDGPNDRISLGDLGSVTDYTIETWFRGNSSTNYENLFHTIDGGGNTGLRMEFSSNWSLGELYVYGDSGNYTILPHTNTEDFTQWHHVAVVGDKTNSKFKIYFDGVLKVDVTTTTFLSTFPNFVIGRGLSASLNTDRDYNGDIDEFRIWNVARSQADIQANMNNEISPQAGLLAYYKFNQGTPSGNNAGETTAFDSSGNTIVYDGTLNGFALNGATSNWVEGYNASNLQLTNDAPAVFPLGDTLVTWTVTDASGNSDSCQQTVTVEDKEAPMIACPSNLTVECDSYMSPAVTGNATATDNCDAAPTIAHSDNITAGSCSGEYIITRTWTATDLYGNSSNCDQIITVVDTTAPEITCPVDITMDTDPGECGAVVNYNVTHSDICSSTTIQQTDGLASGDTFPVGTTTNIFVVTDECGNTNTCSFTVTIEDNEPPNAVCQDITAQLDATGNLIIDPFQIDAGSTDNCGIQSFSVSPNNFNCSSSASNTVTLTVTDVNGNSSSCTATVTVEDIVPPVAICQNATVQLDSDGNRTIDPSDVDGGSFDNCGVQFLSVSPNAFNCSNVGDNTVTLTVTDVNGNQSTCTATVTVEDNPIDYANLQYPESENICEGDSMTAIGQVYENGLTNTSNSPVTSIDVQFAFNTNDTDPSTWPEGNWTNAIPNPSYDFGQNNDEYQATFASSLTPGTYYYTFRYSLTGCEWQYGGYPNGFWNGSNQNNGVLTVLENHTISLASANNNQILCPNTAIDDIVYTLGGGATSASISPALPAGLTFNAATATISGTPTQSGVYNYTVTTIGTDCPTQQLSGSITVKELLDYANLQFPGSDTICEGGSITAYGRIYEAGLTPNAGDPGTIVDAEFGFGSNPDPLTWTNWADAVYNVQVGNDDEYKATFGAALTTGTYYYTFRYSLDGCEWQYGGYSSSGGGFLGGANVVGELTVNEAALITTTYSNISQNTDTNVCGAIVNYASATTTGVPTPTVTYSHPSGSLFPVGTTTVTVTATNSCGTDTKTFDVTITDNEAPTALCQNLTVQLDANGNGSITTADVDNGSNDACGIASLSLDKTTFDCSEIGNNTVKLTVTDNNGNVSTCTAIITVEDNVAPTAVCQDITIQLDINGVASIVPADIDGGSSDNSSLGTLSNWGIIGDATPNGWISDINMYETNTNEYALYADLTAGEMKFRFNDDWNLNYGGANGSLVQNGANIVVSVPGTYFVTLDLNALTYTLTPFSGNGSNDACGIASLSLSQTDFDCSHVGANTVTLTVTDNNGNVSTCTATVTVEDNIAPVVSCPSDITVSNDANDCGAIVNFTPTATDNCTVASIVSSPASGSFFPVGTTQVTVTATDAAGNTDVCMFNVTVNDTEAPDITCPADVAVFNDLNACNAAIIIPELISSDECGIASITNDYNANGANASDTYPVGTTTVEFTVTDIHGNVSTCTFDVVVTDNEAPDITCPVDITVENNLNLCSANVTIPALAQSDECGIASTTWAYTGDTQGTGSGTDASGVFNVGTTTVTFTVTDIHNNVSTCSFTVTVNDTEAPDITCPADVAVFNDLNACNAAIIIPELISSDECGIASITNDYNANGANASDTYPVGTTTVEFTVTDIHGNVSTCTFDVVVTDNEAPDITCPVDITVENNLNLCSANVTIPALAQSDECGIASTTWAYTGDTQGTGSGTDASGVFNVGTTTVTFTVTDIHNNVSTCSFTVTVNDTEAPDITCPADVAVFNDLNACNAAIIIPELISSDECGIASITNDYNANGANASDTYPVGTTTVEFTVTDIHGNVSTCTFDVVVTDNEAPDITCPVDITVENNLNLCSANVTIPALAQSDECGIASTTWAYTGDTQGTGSGTDASGVFNVGTTTVTFTVTDIHNNVSTCSFTVTVNDTEAPDITCPADVAVFNDLNACNAAIIIPELISSDECGIASITNDYNANGANASDTYPVGTTTVEFTVTDIHGNVSTCTFDVVVTDNEAPDITCPVDITVENNLNLCSANVTIPALAQSDECGIASTTWAYTGDTQGTGSGTDASGVFNVGTTTVTFTVTDIHNNVSTCSFTVTVNDTEAPDITCPADVAVFNDLNACNAAIIIPELISSDECGIASITNDYNANGANASDTYPVGTTTVEFTVTDIHGNVSTCTFDVVVTDNEAPDITCPVDITVENNLNLCSANVTIPALAQSDECGIASTTWAYTGDTQGTGSGTDASGVFNVGTTTVTFTVTDIHNNVSTCSFTVTVNDTEAPDITCPADVAVFNDLNACNAAIIIPELISSDECGIASITNDYNANGANASDTYPVGTTTVEFTVTDIHGNVSTCTFDVVVTDNEAPDITCPVDITVENNLNLCSANVTIPALAQSDECGIASTTWAYTGDTQGTGSGTDASGVFNVGTTTVTFTVTDIHNNVSTCSFTVTVNDTEAPDITCPADVAVFNDLNACNAAIIIPELISSDECGIASITNDYNANGANASDTYPVGTTTVEFTVTDIHGNVSTCTFDVVVTDNEAPDITCPVDITVENNLNLCSANVTIPALAQSDECGIASTTWAYTGDTQGTGSGTDASGVFNVGTTTVTFTVTDIHNNVSTCSFTVTVNDTEAPDITCPADVAVFNDLNACNAAIIIPELISSDECGIASITNDYNANGANASDTYPVGTTTVEFTVTDIHGNVSTCTFDVVVTDNEAPDITCPVDITVENNLNLCSANVTIPALAQSDECGIASTTWAYTGDTQGTGSGTDASGVFNVGTTTVTFTVTDIHNNVSTCSFTVTVNDTEAPDITCPADVAVFNDLNACNAAIIIPELISSDECGIASITNDYNANGANASDTYPVGTTTVEFTVTDIHGNVSTCTFDVVVTDNEAPDITCPVDITVENNLNLCSANVTIPALAQSDECGIASTTWAYTGDTQGTGSGTDASGVFNVGTTTVTFTVTDIHNNVSTCSFTVTVNDTEAPDITCPADVAVFNDLNACNAAIIIPELISSDECGIASITNDYNANGANASDTYPVGTTTVEFTVTDIHGNVSTCTFDVVVTDNEAPDITCPVDITVENNLNLCSANVTIPALAQSDECGIASTTWAYTGDTQGTGSGTDASGVFNVGTTTVTFTVTDIHNNVSTCSFTVTVNDTEAPDITCPADVAVFNDLNACNAAIIIPELISSDECGIASITNDYNANGANASDTYPVGTTTVEFTVTDIHGNVSTCTFDVVVTDNEAPDITCPVDITVENNLNLCSANVTIPALAQSDECGIASTTWAYTGDTQGTGSGTDASGVFNVGTTTVTFTVTDIHNNVSTCSFTVTVNDTEAPDITCPADVAVFNDLNACNAAIIIPELISSDECGIASITNDYNANGANASDTYPVGTTTVEFTVTDIHGNVSTCTFDVVVTDNEAPDITCPVDITVENNLNLCSANVTIPALAQSDECGIASTTWAYTGDTQGTGSGTDASGVFNVGTTTVTFTVTDIHNNVSTCSFTVTVNDTEAPDITCPADVAVFNDLNACNAAIIIPELISSDECGIASITNDYNANGANASDTYPVGTTTVEFTVTDIHGNVSTCTFDVVVTDNEAPDITCPVDITVENNLNLCSANVTIPALAQSDECGIASTTWAYTGDTQGTGSGTDASGVFNVGTTTVTFTVTDIHNNVSTCSFTVTVNDTEAPDITCPADVAVFNDLNACNAAIIIPELISSDECGIASITNDYNANGANASDTYPVGTTTVEFTVTDIHGNVSTCTFDVVVTDNEAPDITCPVDITVENNLNLCSANVTIPALAQSDECGIASTTWAYTGDTQGTGSGTDASGVFNVGTTTVTFTVTDIHNNVSTCSFTVTVNDTEAPDITCPADVAVFNDLNACNAAIIIPELISSDECGIASITNDYNANGANASDTYPVGTTTVEFTVTDIHGNVSTCTFDVVVTDNEAPDITCPVDITVENNLNLCSANVTIPALAQSDECGIASTTWAYTGDTQGTGSGTDASGVFNVGTTTVTFTVTDIHNNVSTCSFTVTVNDTEAPDITCPADVAVFNDLNACNAAIIIPELISSDECGIASITNDYNANGANASDTYPVGTTTVEFTVTDIHGNVSTCTFDVVVTDNEAPDITCPVDITVENNLNLCSANVTIPALAQSDECGIASTTWAYTGDTQGTGSGTDASGVFNVGTTTVTFTVTDIHNNVSTCSFTVTVNDTEAPDITCPADVAVFNDLNACNAAIIIPELISSDECGIASITNDYNANGANASDTYPVGTTTVEFTVTDIHGNVSTCTFDVVVTDNEAPDITCPVDITVENNLNLCSANVTIPALAQSDECGIASTTWAYTGDTQGTGSGTDASGVFNVGTTTVTFTVTDIHNNVSTCSFTVTVNDTEAPDITCPADVAVFNDLNACNAAIIIPELISSDECGIASITNDYNANGANASDTYPVGTTTVEFTVTDIHGNVSTCTFDVVVTDNEAPDITCPVDITVENNLNLCSANVTIPALAQSDECGIASTTWAYTGDTQGTGSGTDASGVFNVGTTTVTFTVTDIHNNVSTCSFTVTVNDTEAPDITCPADVAVFNDLNACNAAIIIPELISSDECGIASITNDYNANGANASDTYPVGTTTVEFTVTDIHGNVSTCTFDVVVTDNEAPDITVTNQTQTTDAGVCEAVVTVANPITGDNCAVASIINDYNNTADASDTYLVGTTTISWTVTDIHGNTSQATQDVIVTDDEAPIIECTNLQIYLNNNQVYLDEDGNGNLPISVIETYASDNCDIASAILSQEYFDCDDIGGDLDELIISEYVDGSGDNKWIEIFNGTGNPISLGYPVVNEGVPSLVSHYFLDVYLDGNSTPTQIGLAGTIQDRGVYKIAHSGAYTDNVLTANVKPFQFTIDGDDAIGLSRADNGQTVDYIPAQAWIQDVNLVRKETVLQGSVSGDENEWYSNPQDTYTNLGSHDIEIADLTKNVTLTVTDTSGNVSTCDLEVQINDPIIPVAMGNDITVELDNNGSYSLIPSDLFNDNGIDDIENGSTDACGIASYHATPSTFDCSDVGQNLVMFTVIDVNGNESDPVEVYVYVEDNIAPTVITQDITVQLDQNGEVSIIPADINNGSSDNCTIATYELDIDSFSCDDIQGALNTNNTVEVTLTVTDVNGNVSSETAIVTVEDNVAPESECNIIEVTLNDGIYTLSEYIDGMSNTDVEAIGAGSTDNCAIADMTVVRDDNGTTMFTCDDFDTYSITVVAGYDEISVPVTLTVTDVNGNSSTCQTTVTVRSINPEVEITQSPLPEFCQGAVLVLTAESPEAAEFLWSTGETTDSIEVPGNGTYSVTVTSLTGCTEEASYTVTGFDAGSLISAYTIVATDEVHLQNDNLVQTGGVGVTTPGEKIKVQKASNIVEFAQASQIQINGGSNVGTAIYAPANPIIPSFVYNVYSSNASPSVTINNNQTVTLTGSVYKEVEVKDGATVIFTQSNIYIDELKTKKDPTIEFSGCTNLFLNKELHLDDNSTFNSNGHMVTVYVDDKVEINKNSTVVARIHANDNDIDVKGDKNGNTTYMTGLFIGKKVNGNKNVVWNADPFCDPCPVEAPDNNGGEEPTEDYVIIGFDEVHLHGDIAVQTGGVGVTRYNKTLKVHDDSDIADFGKASKINLNGGSTIGTAIYEQADPIIPLFVQNIYSNSGSPDVTINAGQTVTLNGDNYDKIDVKDGATVVFTQPNVYINELKTDNDVFIEFTGCTNLIIKKKFKLEDGGTINSDGDKVTLYVNDKVEIDKGSWVDANIYAYDDDIDIDGSNNDATFMTGLFIGKKVHAHENVIFNQGQSGAPCAVSPPNDIYNGVNDESDDLKGMSLQVTSWPNPSDLEFNVKITSENTTDVIMISVFDMNNKLVHADEFRPDEVHKFGSRLEGGVYIAKVSQGNKSRVVRLVKY